MLLVEGAAQLKKKHTTGIIKTIETNDELVNLEVSRTAFLPKDCHTARCAEVNLYRFDQHRVPLFPEMLQYGAVRLDTPS